MTKDSGLSKKRCIPCSKGTPPLKGETLSMLYNQLNQGWLVVNEHHLEKEYIFSDFQTALLFTNRVGELAEQEGHHPDIYLSYGKVKILLWTHKIDGLSESDFILAAKCDEVFKSENPEVAPKFLYKIISIQNWEESQPLDFVKLTEDDRQFVHLAKEDQLDRIIDKYWSSISKFIILKLETARLKGQIAFEANPGGHNKYYHLYNGKIPLKAVAEIRLINRPIKPQE